MNVMANNTMVRHLHGRSTVLRRELPRCPTTFTERLLILITFLIFPMQFYVPTVGGLSILFIMFVVLAAYLLLNRPLILATISLHPVFLAAYAFLFVGFLVEYLHPNSSFKDIFRIGQMFAGAMFLASLCRDRKALRAGIYGYLVAGAGLAVLLFLTVYGDLEAASATTFSEASKVRAESLGGKSLRDDPNRMAFIVAQGAVMALALALTASSSRYRKLLLGITLFFFVGTFLPVSRGGVVIAIVGCALVMHASRVSFMKTMLVASLIGATLAVWVPDAVWTRMTFSMETSENSRGREEDSRARVLMSAVEHFPEYALTGVGVGNFYGPWGIRSRFAFKGDVGGAHNVYFQVMIYWGLAGLLALLVVLWQVYQCVPERCKGDGLALCVLGIGVSLFLWSMVLHVLYAKEFSLGLGLLVGAHRWIWTKEILQPMPPERRRYRLSSRHRRQP